MTDMALPTPICEATWRRPARVRGTVRAKRLQPWAEGAVALELTVVDDSGGLTLVFLGRKAIPGIRLGTRMEAEGMVGESRNRLAILNPRYRLLIP